MIASADEEALRGLRRGDCIPCLLPVYRGRCARCGVAFESRCECPPVTDLDLYMIHLPGCAPPDRCGNSKCRARTWAQRKPNPAGRPKVKKEAKS